MRIARVFTRPLGSREAPPGDKRSKLPRGGAFMNGRIFIPGMRLKEMGLCPSTFEARPAIKQGGATLDGHQAGRRDARHPDANISRTVGYSIQFAGSSNWSMSVGSSTTSTTPSRSPSRLVSVSISAVSWPGDAPPMVDGIGSR